MTWLSLPLAFGLMWIGAFATVDPRRASAMFGIPSSDPFVRAAGVRDIALGLIVLMAFMHGRFNLLGEICACMAVIPLGDALLTYSAGARRFAAAHFASAIGCFVYGLYLMMAN